MKYTTLKDIAYNEKKDWIKTTDLENIFHIYTDRKSNNFYNLNNSIYVKVPPEYIQIHRCTIDSTWTLLSYKIYGTTRLAWLLMKLNNVKTTECFQLKHPGDYIYYISKDMVELIVSDMNNVEQ